MTTHKVVIKGNKQEIMDRLNDMAVEADWVSGRVAELTEILNIALNAGDMATVVWVATEALLLAENATNPFALNEARGFIRFVIDEVRCTAATPLN